MDLETPHTPPLLNPLKLKLHGAISRVLEDRPYWRNEGIRINGVGGMLEALMKYGVRRTAGTVRAAIKELNLKTVGFGMVARGLPSRERLVPIIREVVDGRPDWKNGYIKVRGKNGIKAALYDRGFDVNQVVIRRALDELGLKAWPLGVHHAAKLFDIPVPK